jgi:hypothetical protein
MPQGFYISDIEQEKINAWKKEQDAKVINAQKGTRLEHSGEAYYGCSGGAYTYEFTPTSIGIVVVIRNCITNDSLDLTDYDNW